MSVAERNVAAMRRFSRFYTRQIGLLQGGFLQSEFSLTEGRVLYELSNRDRPTASELAADLGLDHGYLSRILRRFADSFRRTCLAKSVQLYPYLRWALEKDRMATIQFKSTHRELERSTLLIEAVLTDYLDAPWDSGRRRRFVHDVVRIAGLFAQIVRQEESTLLPLYMPPGQYRYVDGVPAI